VPDAHVPEQEIDGLREAELAGKQIGTTKRGIGPAYASKATRNGLRVGELRDMAAFAGKLRALALDGAKRFEGFQYDVEVCMGFSFLNVTVKSTPFLTTASVAAPQMSLYVRPIFLLCKEHRRGPDVSWACLLLHARHS
jgi:adenylosuccinate synthase